MKVAVVGSRDITNLDLAAFLPDGITVIVSGGARGIDTLAERYAKRRGIKTLIFRPDYETHGKSAPLIRNREIVDAADCVYAFWDGKSRGTMHAVNYAKKTGKPVEIISL